MKVLVATKETQGKRSNDFSWAEEGELVTFGSQCDGATPDDRCGCARSMTGIVSRKGTTTIKVIERDMLFGHLVNKIRASMEKAFPGMENKTRELAIEDAKDLCVIAKAFKKGDVLEFRGDRFVLREKPKVKK